MGVLPIVLDGLVFRPTPDRAVIDGLSAAIASEGITAIIGPNGAGKSVTLRILDGLLRPDAGSIAFGTRQPHDVRRALVFQMPGFIRASAARNVALALADGRRGKADIRMRIEAALAQVGLAGRARDAARKLSGGERQRLALARALVTEPELLLLDEPTASLDPGAAKAIDRLIAEISAGGTKVVLVSHNFGQVARLAEDVLVLAQGRVAEHGPVAQVLSEPRALITKTYLEGELPWIR